MRAEEKRTCLQKQTVPVVLTGIDKNTVLISNDKNSGQTARIRAVAHTRLRPRIVSATLVSHCTSIIKRMSGARGRMMTSSWACAHGRRPPLGGGRKRHPRGGDGHDFLSSGTGNDSLYGGDGADYLDCGAGIDTLAGSDGNDRRAGSAESGTFLAKAGRTSSSSRAASTGSLVSSPAWTGLRSPT